MTVVAYSARHRILAADSRCSSTELDKHVTNLRKIFRLASGALLGFAGEADVRDLVALFSSATPDRMPSRAEVRGLKTDNEAIIVFPTGEIFGVEVEYEKRLQSWRAEVVAIDDPFIAIGSGAAYAYGAMEFGASPAEAVACACKRDLFCALPVREECLDVKPRRKR